MCIKFETAPATIASFLSNKIPLRSEQHELSLAAFVTVDEFDVVANGFVSSKILNCRYSAIAVAIFPSRFVITTTFTTFFFRQCI